MPLLVILLVVSWLIASRLPSRFASVPKTLCHGCVCVHRVKGFNGEELISCNFGSELIRIQFPVSECSGYLENQGPKLVRIVGFARPESAEREAFPATVIHIAAETEDE